MVKADADSIISIEDVSDFGMVTIKANFSDVQIHNLIRIETGVETPKIGKISFGKKLSVAWMSVDELAIILRDREADKITKKFKQKLKNHHHLCVNMSDSRRCFRLLGKSWREILSKGSPSDLRPGVFGAGSFRRTRIVNLPVGIWAVNEAEAYIFTMHSVGSFLSNWLASANLKSGHLNYYK